MVPWSIYWTLLVLRVTKNIILRTGFFRKMVHFYLTDPLEDRKWYIGSCEPKGQISSIMLTQESHV